VVRPLQKGDGYLALFLLNGNEPAPAPREFLLAAAHRGGIQGHPERAADHDCTALSMGFTVPDGVFSLTQYCRKPWLRTLLH
jgi:hypothetical protein